MSLDDEYQHSRPFAANYASDCGTCGEQIEPGDRVAMAEGEAHHLGCLDHDDCPDHGECE